MEEVVKMDYIPVGTEIHRIEAGQAWEQLDKNEKHYAYYFNQASWLASRICYFQRSYESPALFVIFQVIFQDFADLKQASLNKGINEEEWNQMTVYAAAVFQNTGNYKSFGDTKFVPQLGEEKFRLIMKAAKDYPAYSEILDYLWESIKDVVYNSEAPFKAIGFRDKEKTSSYYSHNITKAEAELINDFQVEHKIPALNTRLLKLGPKNFLIKIASARTGKLDYLKKYKYKDVNIEIRNGEFSAFLNDAVVNLQKAAEFCTNQNQKQMLLHYIQHFKYGDIEMHKKSQINWIQDINPIVETNIGFIESYVDPLGVRAEFEGFVAIVNKEESLKFSVLVENADKLILKLPWGKEFEKDVFKKPNFTSLEILGFGSSGTPIGINIPNYYDVREKHGFKNVNLGNVYPIPKKENIRFLSEDDAELFCKHFKDSLLVVVALHELLGHGTGKLLSINEEGKLNFPEDLKNPFTGEPITTYYKPAETYETKFQKLHSQYEECRADSVAAFLSCFEEPFEILMGDRKEDWDDMLYVIWMEMAYAGMKGLQYYDPDTNTWLQAHVTAAYVIMQVFRKAGEDFLTYSFDQRNGKEHFRIHLDRTKIKTVGFKAMSEFLRKLMIYKSMGDYEGGAKFFEEYMKVDEEFLKMRKIVFDHLLPRRLELQPNIFGSEGEEELRFKYEDYEMTFEGIIESYIKRFNSVFAHDMFNKWQEDKFLMEPKLIEHY